jgi:hypothetical protein
MRAKIKKGIPGRIGKIIPAIPPAKLVMANSPQQTLTMM